MATASLGPQADAYGYPSRHAIDGAKVLICRSPQRHRQPIFQIVRFNSE